MNEQATLFDEIEKRHRKHHKKTGRKRGDYTSYWMFLLRYKQLINNGKTTSITALQKQFKVGKFRTDLMPTDIETIPVEQITYEYTCKWVKERLNPYFKAGRSKNENKPIIVMAQPAKPSLVELMEDLNRIGSQFIATITDKILEIQTIINSTKNYQL